MFSLTGRIAYMTLLPFLRQYLKHTRRAYILVVAEGKILVVKNILSRGQWHLPGGGIRKNETPQQAAKRELQEEVNLSIETPLEQTAKGTWQTDKLGQTYFIFMVKLPKLPQARRLWLELSDAAWLNPAELNPRNTSAEILAALKISHLV